MAKIVKSYTRPDGAIVYRFHCPGCKCSHFFHVGRNTGWTWNEDENKPTVNPSLLVIMPNMSDRCHSFIRDGKIQFLNDCTHELAGKTVDLSEVDDE